MNRIAYDFTPVGIRPGSADSPKQEKGPETASDFAEALRSAQDDSGVTFSRHATERLKKRNISMSPGQLERLNSGVSRARAKNINESLIMVDNMSFIVNVPHNTVVTAMDSSDEKVFTNIDGAVIN